MSKNSKIDLKQVKEFLKILETTDVEEFEWKNNDFHIRFVRDIKEEITSKKEKAVSKEKTKKEETKKEESSVKLIKSPVIGTIAEISVKEGDEIKKGSLLCRIQTLKVKRDIKSEFSGKVKGVLIKEGEKVEYGKELFEIE
ncbi:MAG: hypothetical protein DRI36_06510 [Caldiserica bacterium]|nr:MAG: hypothetical protein DRI36_06510 [Caldisericota bacterium]